MKQNKYSELSFCSRGPSHVGLPIIMICFEKDCKRKRLCCLSCIDQLHTKHQLMSLQKFYKFVEKTVSENTNSKDKKNVLETLELFRERTKSCLENFKKTMATKIDEVMKKSDQHFASIIESYMQKRLQDVQIHVKQQFNDEKVEQYFEVIQKASENLTKSFKEIHENAGNAEKNFGEKLLSTKKELQKNLDVVLNSFLQFSISQNNFKNFQFNPQTKSAYVMVQENNKKIRRFEGAGGYPIALVNKQFTPLRNTVSFKIISQVGAKGIWMGVCILDIVKNFNFQSCYGIGKGSWGIDQVSQNHSSAFTWSHHDTNYNSSPKVGWQFMAGDVVDITVDYQKSVVRFTKNKSLHYQQPIKLDLGALYAFAGPTHINDTIGIVD